MTALRDREFSGRNSGLGLIALITISITAVILLAYFGRASS